LKTKFNRLGKEANGEISDEGEENSSFITGHFSSSRIIGLL
jgi:hypothetical protein